MDGGQLEIKYQHLNPSTYFQEVVQTARSVVLAGGTMSPVGFELRKSWNELTNYGCQMSDIVNQLFSSLPPEKLVTFSCGHIIPPENLKALVVRKGSRGGDLQFKYEQRNDQALVSTPHPLSCMAYVRRVEA